jgi:hypothetical protein
MEVFNDVMAWSRGALQMRRLYVNGIKQIVGNYPMRKLFGCLAMMLSVSGCISISSTSPPKQTIIVPPAPTTTVVCPSGYAPPC